MEACTYRFWGHHFGDDMAYMPPNERAMAMAADPVPRYRTWLIEEGHSTDAELAAFEARVEEQITDAVEYAQASPFPEAGEVYTDVYAEAAPA